MTKINKVVLLDFSTYHVELDTGYLRLKRKIHAYQIALWEKIAGVKYIRPGLAYSRGLLLIATMLGNAGFNPKYFVYSDPDDFKMILQFCIEADVVCIYAVTPTINRAAAACQKIKKENPDIKIIVGGPHATSLPSQTLNECHEFDYILCGDGGEGLLEFFNNELNFPEKIPGLYFRFGNQIIEPIERLSVDKLNQKILPAYKLLSKSVDSYSHNLRISQGCPFSCKFCIEARSHIGHISLRPIPHILEELDYLAQRSPRDTLIHFSDANFTMHTAYTRELLQEIRKRKYSFVFSFDTRVDLLPTDLIPELISSRFIFFRLGFEAIQQSILDISNKGIVLEQQKAISEDIHTASKQAIVFSYFITGLPGTSLASLHSANELVAEMGFSGLFDILSNKVFVPYPGSEFYHSREKYGLDIKTYDWNAYDRQSPPVFNYSDLSSSVIYKEFKRQQATLLRIYKKKLGYQLNDLTGHHVNEDNVYNQYLRAHSSY